MVVSPPIDAITERLRAAAPDATIILFGSRARGDARTGSDVDILVVEPRLASRHAETVRLLAAVCDLDVEVDIVVASAAAYAKWSTEPCTVYYDAARDGRVLHAPR